MLEPLRTLDRRLLMRRCVACGYDGALLRGGQAMRCARCGCDLRQRPARSYAEMEGLLGHPMTVQAPFEAQDHQRQEHLIHRWLAVLFLAMIGIVAIAFLSAAALEPV
jgi:hypothetical protein